MLFLLLLLFYLENRANYRFSCVYCCILFTHCGQLSFEIVTALELKLREFVNERVSTTRSHTRTTIECVQIDNIIISIAPPFALASHNTIQYTRQLQQRIYHKFIYYLISAFWSINRIRFERNACAHMEIYTVKSISERVYEMLERNKLHSIIESNLTMRIKYGAHMIFCLLKNFSATLGFSFFGQNRMCLFFFFKKKDRFVEQRAHNASRYTGMDGGGLTLARMASEIYLNW